VAGLAVVLVSEGASGRAGAARPRRNPLDAAPAASWKTKALAAAILVLSCWAATARGAESEAEQARRLWAASPHGEMLSRILPPSVEPRDLPEPDSDGARLTARYCVQCHHLVNPAMHAGPRWKGIVDRMVWRMRGNGNLGELMREMMGRVQAPTNAEVETLTRYLQRHGQVEISPEHPALSTRAGEAFAIACSQCHALPGPRRHTAREWPGVVERMKRHMAWTNVVVGSPELRTSPELKTEEIVTLLQKYARR
jgi:cytochrome c2